MVAAEVVYEVTIVPAPYAFTLRGVEFRSANDNDDIVVLMRRIWSGGILMEETIVGVIGDEYRGMGLEFLRLRNYVNAGGVIRLNKELVG